MPDTRDAVTDKAIPAHAPADNAVLDLVPPAAVGLVGPEEAEERLAIDPAAAVRIDRLVAAFVTNLDSLDVHSGAYRRLVADVSRPTDAMKGVLSGKAPIARRLTQLRRALEDLDPSKYDLTRRGSRSFLGVIPMGDRLDAYFERYAGAQARIRGIVLALTTAREALIRDNAVIGQEQASLWMEMETLRQYAHMAERLDAALELRMTTLEPGDPDGARLLREDVLFPVRQRRQDILTQLAVATQGYAALRVVEQNNLAVIRSIQGATTTTVAALRTAAMVAQALGNQRQLVEQITRATEQASGMLDNTARMLQDRADEVELRVAAGGADVAALEGAWREVFAVLDHIDVYKRAALASMKVTASQLSTTVARARASAEHLEIAAGSQGARPGTVREPTADITSMLTLEAPSAAGNLDGP